MTKSWTITESPDAYCIGPEDEVSRASVRKWGDESIRAANLIAAAPDLLEALKEVAPRVHYASHPGTFGACTHCSKSVAAINKAEGR